MVCICTPLGLHPANFFPTEAGKDYASTPYLDVLKDLRDDFSVISGLSHPDVGSSHDSIYSYLTCGSAPGTAGRLSQHDLARPVRRRTHRRGQTRFQQPVAVGRRFWLVLDPLGPLVPSELYPAERVRPAVPGRAGPMKSPTQERRLQDGRSILDAVGDQARRMQPALACSDREKLDEYFTSVRELEQRMATSQRMAKQPKPQGRRPSRRRTTPIRPT